MEVNNRPIEMNNGFQLFFDRKDVGGGEEKKKQT